jgi:hypothetical protein
VLKLLAVTAALVTLGSVAASADPYERGRFPYQARHHDVCQDKAQRLHRFENRASADGRIDRREARIADELRRDLRRTCGGFRWRG